MKDSKVLLMGGMAIGAIAGFVAARIFSDTKKTGSGKLQLKYWGGRGLMEVPRLMLALSGRFPPDSFCDGRYKGYGDENSNLEWNLGRMPLIMKGDRSVGQSGAINYFIATECGLIGEDSMDAAQILSIQESLKEMNQAFRKIVPYGSAPTEEQLTQWFETGATDRGFGVPADMKTRGERMLMWYAGRLEDIIGDDYAVGGTLSLADVLIFNTFRETLPEDQCGAGFDGKGVPAYNRVPFGSKEKTDALLAKYSKLKAICDNVESHPNTQKWLAMRGVQNF